MNEAEVLKRITQLRLQKGLSETQLSKAIGHGKSYVNAVISGEVNLSISTFLKICSVLGVSPCSFFQDDIDYPKEYDSLANIIKNLSKEKMEALITLLEE